MPKLIPVLEKSEIKKLVESVGRRISEDYSGKSLVLIGVLKGSFMFLSDLARCIHLPVEIDFIQVASYGAGTSSSGEIKLVKDLDIDILNRDVLLVEDIVDSGLSLTYLTRHLNGKGPASLKICAMIDKCERREVEVCVDYACHSVDHGFLVGYGLDYNQRYRELPGIYHLEI